MGLPAPTAKAVRAALLVTLITLAGCSADSADERVAPIEPDRESSTTALHDGWGELDWDAEGDLSGGESADMAMSGAGAEVPAVDEDAVETSGPATTIPTSSESAPIDTALNAGSVDDNAAWEDYLLYRQDFRSLGIPVDDIDVDGRQIVTVVDADGRPVLGAQIVVTDQAGAEVARLRTHADGRALFFADSISDPQSQSPSTLRATVTRGDASTTVDLAADSREHHITLDGVAHEERVQLDVLFLLDTTGSMGDEIEQLKANMISVSEQIDGLPGEVDVRYAMTVYRDHGDAFVTQSFDFTDDVAFFTDGLREVVAGGGGDTPEALDEALHEALTTPTWRDGDAVKLVFLVADAAPHIGEAGAPSYAADVFAANEEGVKIFPIASSGSDPQAEYVFRQLAQVTMARFSFLTYGADGVSPGEETPMEVEDYAVLSLDQLVVEMVTDELAARS